MCDACTNAERHPRSAKFAANCDGCSARALAVTFADVAASGQQTPAYRMAVAQFFPSREQAGHALVKQWAQRLKRPGSVCT